MNSVKKDKRKYDYECRAIERIVSGEMKSLFDVYRCPSSNKRHAWAIIEEERNIYRRRDGDIVSKVFILTHSIQMFTCAFLYQPKEMDKNEWMMKIHTPYDSWTTYVLLSDTAVHNALDPEEFKRWQVRPLKGEPMKAVTGREDTSSDA